MRTARSSSRPGGSPSGTLPREQAPPGSRHPPDQAPPRPGTPREQTSPPGPGTPLLTEFLTHAYENITLPQTSFAGGNK